VDYFKGKAFLAQSPQLGKQMAISADFGRVYEIGPVFRAEDSNTNRHMTEFTGLDLEMAFQEHYHEVVDLLNQLFMYIFSELPKRYATEIAAVRRQYPSEEFLVPEAPVCLNFKEGIQMLRDAGYEVNDLDDLSTDQAFVGHCTLHATYAVAMVYGSCSCRLYGSTRLGSRGNMLTRRMLFSPR